jgi:hypothetical protein
MLARDARSGPCRRSDAHGSAKSMYSNDRSNALLAARGICDPRFLLSRDARRDMPLDSGQEPPWGAHIVSPRRGYTHHGIYVGSHRVVQYGGLTRGLRRGPVEEVLLTQFSQRYPIWVRFEESRWFDRDEVVRRARSRLGEDNYHPLTNNCEHFCEWCVRGQQRSYQVDELLSRPGRALRLTIRLVARLLYVRNSTARSSAADEAASN